MCTFVGCKPSRCPPPEPSRLASEPSVVVSLHQLGGRGWGVLGGVCACFGCSGACVCFWAQGMNGERNCTACRIFITTSEMRIREKLKLTVDGSQTGRAHGSLAPAGSASSSTGWRAPARQGHGLAGRSNSSSPVVASPTDAARCTASTRKGVSLPNSPSKRADDLRVFSRLAGSSVGQALQYWLRLRGSLWGPRTGCR